jgi:hypothetical protein
MDKKRCNLCECDIRKNDFARHCNTKKHKDNLGKNDTIQPVSLGNISITESESDEEDDEEDEEGEYLGEFSNTNFNAPVVEPPKPIAPPPALSSREKLQHLFQNKQRVESALPPFIKRRDNENSSVKSDELFSDKHQTKIVGREVRELLARVRQYKSIFKKELKTFKIKKNANARELQQYLDEMQSILDTQTQNDFMGQAIYQVLGIAEGISTRFRDYDVSGLTEMLRSSKEFNDILKVLSLKYSGNFGQVPPEAQMALILIGTAYICMSKNRMERRLNESFTMPQPMPQPNATLKETTV